MGSPSGPFLEMGATVDFSHELSYPTLNVSLDSNLVRMTVKAMEEEGVTPHCMVIGGGSVVVKDIPSDSLAVGNPARVVKKLPPRKR